MYIEKEIIVPNGAATSKHRISKMELSPSQIMATVNSYTDMAWSNAPEGASPLIAWQQVVSMPIDVISSDPFADVATALTDPGGYLAGGTIEADVPAAEPGE